MKLDKTSTIRDILVKLRKYSSIAVGLSLYSMAFNDKLAALEVLRIENAVDELYRSLIARIIIALRSTSYLPTAVSLLSVYSSIDEITDASADIAGAVLRGYRAHPYITAVACRGEAVGLITSRSNVRGLPARVDVLLLRRGEKYEIAPEIDYVSEGDLLVVRGPPDEILQLARALGEEHYEARCSEDFDILAHLGDPLASNLLGLKSLSFSMLDLAFYSILNDDVEIAEAVVEMESWADKLYHEILELAHSWSRPSDPLDAVSLFILVKSLEELSDAATRIAKVVVYRENPKVIGEALEEGEEAYIRVKASENLKPSTVKELDFEDRGLIPIAMRRGGDWIAPLTPSHEVRPGDELILKYYRESVEAGAKVLEELRHLGFEKVRVEKS